VYVALVVTVQVGVSLDSFLINISVGDSWLKVIGLSNEEMQNACPDSHNPSPVKRIEIFFFIN
jgi:hypothetical protein